MDTKIKVWIGVAAAVGVAVIVLVVLLLTRVSNTQVVANDVTGDTGSFVIQTTPSPTLEPTPIPTPEPSIDPTEIKPEYKETCEKLDYESFARNPDKYGEKEVYFSANVVQVMQDEIDGTVVYSMRLAVDADYDNMLFVFVPKDEDKILKDDIIKIYGTTNGLYTYESIMDEQISIPLVYGMFYEIL